MQRDDIPFEDFCVHAFGVWDRQWLLLAAGDFAKKDYNCMTVGWGSLGVMWGRPFAMIVVRPTRHTHRFTEAHATFTLSAFAEEHRQKLSYCGSHSGRDGDKVKASGLTPVAARQVAAPAFDEAELVLECRKMYADGIDPSLFVDPSLDANYPKKDYHRVYFGEIVSITGTAAWRRKE